MTPGSDDLPTWEVVPNFRERSGIPLYQAPPSGSPDARVVEGHRPHMPPFVPALFALPMSISMSLVGPIIVRLAVGISVIIVGLTATAIITARRRAWKIPRVVTTSEGVTVTDIHGEVRSAQWSDVRSPSLLRQKVGRDEVVQLEWTTPAGEHVALNLGDTMDLVEVRHAITARAPSTLELRSEAKFAYDEEGSDE